MLTVAVGRQSSFVTNIVQLRGDSSRELGIDFSQRGARQVGHHLDLLSSLGEGVIGAIDRFTEQCRRADDLKHFSIRGEECDR